eukprot:Gb_33412 [translate_table: standard]
MVFGSSRVSSPPLCDDGPSPPLALLGLKSDAGGGAGLAACRGEEGLRIRERRLWKIAWKLCLCLQVEVGLSPFLLFVGDVFQLWR